MTEALLTAFGLVLVIEGLLYALVPGQLKRMLAAMTDFSEDRLRLGGLVALALGVLFIWAVRGLAG